METNIADLRPAPKENFNFGHVKIIFMAALLLLGLAWFKNPQLFSALGRKQEVKKISANVPRYYAYVPPAEDMQPMVAGASTVQQGPMIINEDGSVTPALDAGTVLGASTENIQLPLDQIAVSEIPDSGGAIQKYFSDAQLIESNYINNADFEAALNSGNQQQINAQAQKLTGVKNNLQKLEVPRSLVKLQKLKIAQYQAAIAILGNFTKADENPELVGQYLDQFLKSQQDLDAETAAINQKYNLNNPLTDNVQQ